MGFGSGGRQRKWLGRELGWAGHESHKKLGGRGMERWLSREHYLQIYLMETYDCLLAKQQESYDDERITAIFVMWEPNTACCGRLIKDGAIIIPVIKERLKMKSEQIFENVESRLEI